MKSPQSSVRLIATAFAAALALTNCTKDTTTLPTNEAPPQDAAAERSQIIHHVSVGGADFCYWLGEHPGCDGNFSLVANMDEDGNVTGQYTDQFGQGEGGFHAEINCLTVVGNTAWVSGIVTSGNLGGTDVTGWPVHTKIVDNGNGQNSGDLISYSYLGSSTLCTAQANLQLFPITGQVKVW